MRAAPTGPLRALGGAMLLAFAAGCAAPGPRNLSTLKDELTAYVESGAYDREIAAVAARAQRWVEERAARGGPRLTVVIDLDETLLRNWPEMKATDYGYVPAAWEAWVDRGEAPAIEPVREVYRTARRLGIDVVFVTGRTERDRPGTERNLRALGCADYAELRVRPAGAQSNAGFKTAVRRELAAAGRTIIANLGDQESDLAGGYAERTFKLPNPFYLTP